MRIPALITIILVENRKISVRNYRTFTFDYIEAGGDLNSELSRVVTELESAIHERRKKTDDDVDVTSEEATVGDDDEVEEKALEVQ